MKGSYLDISGFSSDRRNRSFELALMTGYDIRHTVVEGFHLLSEDVQFNNAVDVFV